MLRTIVCFTSRPRGVGICWRRNMEEEEEEEDEGREKGKREVGE